MAWEFLDERFKTSQQPSQEILNTILSGPVVSLSDLATLPTFAQACAAAQRLIQEGSETLSPLENQTTQEIIFDRLEQELSRKWFEHRLENDAEEGPVDFQLFVEWIRRRSKVELGRRGRDQKHKTIETSTSYTPGSGSRAPGDESRS